MLFSHEDKLSVPLEDLPDQKQSVIRVQNPVRASWFGYRVRTTIDWRVCMQLVSMHRSRAERDSDDESALDRREDVARAV